MGNFNIPLRCPGSTCDHAAVKISESEPLVCSLVECRKDGLQGTWASTCRQFHVSGAGVMKQEAPVIDHVSPPLGRIAISASSTCAITSCQLQSLLLRPEVITRTRLATKLHTTACLKQTSPLWCGVDSCSSPLPSAMVKSTFGLECSQVEQGALLR